jgi:hypothetical protein
MHEMHLTFQYSAGAQVLPYSFFASTFWLRKSSFLDAVPTAELEPITETYVQADEVLDFVLSSELIALTVVYVTGGYGSDLRRIISFRKATQSR